MANLPPEGDTPHPLTDDEKAELLRQFHDDSKTESKTEGQEYADVESLSQDVKTEAIAIAREILEKLKIVYEDISLLDLITITETDILDDFSEDIHDLEALFAFQVDQALHIDPTLANDPEVALASDALGMMGAVTRAYAKKKSGQITDEMLSLMAQKEIQNAEQRNQQLKGKTVDKLAEDIERGLNKVQEKTRDAQRQMTPENLDLRLEQGLESRGMSPERSQQQSQQQQRQQQQQQGQQTMQAQQMVQSLRQINQSQQGQQMSSQQQSQARRAAGSSMVQDVVRRRLQQQLRNQNQMGQQGQNQQVAQRQQQQQVVQMQQMQQAWRAQQQILRRAMQRQQQRLQEMARIRATQRAMSAHHHDDHHHDHHDDDHHRDHSHHPEKGLGQKAMPNPFKPIMNKSASTHKGDLSKLLAGADLSALKHNLSTVDTGQTVVGPRTAKDTIREIQATQNGERPDDLPPLPPKKGPLVGM